MYIKHVKPMKRAHNKKRSVYRGEKFVRKKSIDIAALLLVLLILLLAGSEMPGLPQIHAPMNGGKR